MVTKSQEGWIKVGYRKHNHCLPVRREQGFTLIELILVIAITAILARLAVTSFSNSIHNNRVLTYTNGLLSGLTLAKNTAIQRGNYVIMCATDDPTASTPACGTNWASGWLVYYSTTTTGTPTTANLIKTGDSSSGSVATSGTAAAKIVFTSRGTVYNNTTDVTIIANATSCTSGKDKQITITLGYVGRTNTTAGTCP
jgi:type IV fimbrial biogenesis protein FimT